MKQIAADSVLKTEGDLDGFPAGKNTVTIKTGDWNRFELTVRGATAALQRENEDRFDPRCSS